MDRSDQVARRRNGYAVAFTSAHDWTADSVEFELPSRGDVFLHRAAHTRRQTVERLLELRDVNLRPIRFRHRARLNDGRIQSFLQRWVGVDLALIFSRCRSHQSKRRQEAQLAPQPVSYTHLR